jgi:hypothetical protein
MPSLINHFTEHQHLNPQMGLIDFMSMHYWGEDIKDNDYEKDMQLPFKKIDIQQTCFLFIPQSHTIVFHDISWPSGPNYGLMHSQNHYNTILGTLFRPPQV